MKKNEKKNVEAAMNETASRAAAAVKAEKASEKAAETAAEEAKKAEAAAQEAKKAAGNTADKVEKAISEAEKKAAETAAEEVQKAADAMQARIVREIKQAAGNKAALLEELTANAKKAAAKKAKEEYIQRLAGSMQALFTGRVFSKNLESGKEAIFDYTFDYVDFSATYKADGKKKELTGAGNVSALSILTTDGKKVVKAAAERIGAISSVIVTADRTKAAAAAAADVNSILNLFGVPATREAKKNEISAILTAAYEVSKAGNHDAKINSVITAAERIACRIVRGNCENMKNEYIQRIKSERAKKIEKMKK